MKEEKVIEDALRFAAVAHDRSYRKGTKLPYIVHPIEVVFIVSGMTDDRDVIAAAALHDVVEDTSYTIDDIRQRFGERIAGFVACESENKREELPPELTWTIRKQEFLDKIDSEPVEVKLIALGDKLSNLRSTNEEYEKIGDAVFEKFNQKDKEAHAWYHIGVMNKLSELSGFDAWKEYRVLCERIFGDTLVWKKIKKTNK